MNKLEPYWILFFFFFWKKDPVQFNVKQIQLKRKNKNKTKIAHAVVWGNIILLLVSYIIEQFA